MRHLALLAAVYLLAAALLLPGSLLASEKPPTSDPAQAGEPRAAPGAEQEADMDPVPSEDAHGTPPSETVAAQPTPEPGSPSPEAAPSPETLPTNPSGRPAPSNEQDGDAADREGDGADRDGDAAKRRRAQAAASTSVTIKDFEFSPTSVTIDVGDTVTWNNEGPTPHSATADDGSFDTGIFGKGGSRSHTFEEAGRFSYFCTPHPFMKASVTVQASDSGTGDGGGSAGGADTSGGAGADDTGVSGADADDGSGLPATGRDSGTLLMLGALMLALGLAVHRRARTG